MSIEFNRVTWYSKLFALALVLVVFAFGYYLGTRHTDFEILFPHEEGVFCTADAKICPDGTAVGRTGPHCDFAPCPTPTNLTGTDAGAPDIPQDGVYQ